MRKQDRVNIFVRKFNKPMKYKIQGVRHEKDIPVAVDLFAGCGGLTVGLKRAGYRVVAAIDVNVLASQTYRANHPEVHFVENDIRKISTVDLMNKLGLRAGELDLLAGCPPCQGFSTLRTRNNAKAVEDDRNDLVLEFLRFAEDIRPRSIMLENVPGLESDHRFVHFVKRLSDLGYKGNVEVLDVSNFGVPQRRKRLIFMASLTEKPQLAKPKSGKPKTVKDAIFHLPKPGKSGDLLHDSTRKHSDKVMRLIKSIPRNGGSRSDLPEELRLECHKRCNGFKDVYGRMKWDDVAPTITSGCTNPSKGRFIHPDQNRAITLREASILQGFPKGYKFPAIENKGAIALMIGNALPPPFVAAHAKSLLKMMKQSSE